MIVLSAPATGAREVGCTVPNLTGLSVQQARLALIKHHCPVSALRVRKVCAPLSQFGKVLPGQRPAAGAKLRPGQLVVVRAGMRCGNPTPPPLNPPPGIAALDGNYEVTLSGKVSIKYGAQNQPTQITEEFQVVNGTITGQDFQGKIDPATRKATGQTSLGYPDLNCPYEAQFTPSGNDVDVTGTFTCASDRVTVTDGKIAGHRVS